MQEGKFSVVVKTFSIEKEKLEALKELSKEIGLSQSLLIRMTVDDLLKDKKRLK